MKITPGTSPTQTTFFSTSGAAEGVAVDGAGNVYVSDSTGALTKVTPDGLTTTLISVTGTNTPNLYGLALDAAGNLYAVDNANNQIDEVAPGGAQSTVLSGLNNPIGVSVDAAGDLYIGVTPTTKFGTCR